MSGLTANDFRPKQKLVWTDGIVAGRKRPQRLEEINFGKPVQQLIILHQLSMSRSSVY